GGSGSGSSGNSSNEELMKAVLGAKSGISKISLNCPVFDSDSRDKLHFKDWFQQYEAVLNASHGIDDKNKLVYLRSKVKGTASSYLASLEVTNVNYKEAIKLLKTHYRVATDHPISNSRRFSRTFPGTFLFSRSIFKDFLGVIMGHLKKKKKKKKKKK
ncbi:unnamed protein product, partial [Meganyctiphanes norvegica]